jgi:hypothetical protein
VASISSMSHSVTREWIDRHSMIRSTANSIHELSTRGGLAQPLVTEGAGLVVGIADLDPSGLSPLVIQRALVSVPQVSYTRSHDEQSEKERLLLADAVAKVENRTAPKISRKLILDFSTAARSVATL